MRLKPIKSLPKSGYFFKASKYDKLILDFLNMKIPLVEIIGWNEFHKSGCPHLSNLKRRIKHLRLERKVKIVSRRKIPYFINLRLWKGQV